MKRTDDHQHRSSFDQYPPDRGDLDRALTDLSKGIDRVFATAAAFDRTHWGEDAGRRLFEELEVVPGRRLRRVEEYILRAYDIFRRQGPAFVGVRGEALSSELSQRALAAFETMCEATFGAFAVTFKDGHKPIASRVDGLPADSNATLAFFGKPDFGRHLTAGTYVGWLVELEGRQALVLAGGTDAVYHKRLSEAAERCAWGDGDAFRARDYEQDVLSLLIDRQCVDTGRCGDRVFLSSALEERLYRDGGRLRERVAQRLLRDGLPGAYDPPKSTQKSQHETQRSRDSKVTRKTRPRAAPLSGDVANWSLEAALVAGASFTAARDVLEMFRRECLPRPVSRRAPLGDHSAEYLLPLDELVDLLGLSADGGVDHPRAELAEHYRMKCLEIDRKRFEAAGFEMSWPIATAVGWAAVNAEPSLQSKLESAVHRHRAAIRWAAIVDKNQRDDRDQLLEVTYDDLIGGLERLIPSVLDTPLEALDAPRGGAWPRLEAGAREKLEVDDGPLLLGDLPATRRGVSSLPGVGDVTVDALEEALVDLVAKWPESVGHYAVHPSDAEASGDDLADGLDDLEGMF